jgi:MFS family permease
MPVQATTSTIVQQATTDAVRGRVAGALNAAVQTATIASMAAAGILGDVVGIRTVFLAGAIVTGVAAVVAWLLFRGATMPDLEPSAEQARRVDVAAVRAAGDALPHSAAGAD